MRKYQTSARHSPHALRLSTYCRCCRIFLVQLKSNHRYHCRQAPKPHINYRVDYQTRPGAPYTHTLFLSPLTQLHTIITSGNSCDRRHAASSSAPRSSLTSTFSSFLQFLQSPFLVSPSFRSVSYVETRLLVPSSLRSPSLASYLISKERSAVVFILSNLYFNPLVSHPTSQKSDLFSTISLALSLPSHSYLRTR